MFLDYFPLYIEPLVSQCMEWCDSYNHPILVPLTTWLDNIHTPCVDTIANLPNLTCAELLPNGQHVLIGSGNKVLMYHIASKRLVKSFQGLLNYKMSQCMRFPTMWYVQPAKPQISLRIRAV